jgi:hypothetical protein
MGATIAGIAINYGREVSGNYEEIVSLMSKEEDLVSVLEPYLGQVIKDEDKYFNILSECPNMKFRVVERTRLPVIVL